MRSGFDVCQKYLYSASWSWTPSLSVHLLAENRRNNLIWALVMSTLNLATPHIAKYNLSQRRILPLANLIFPGKQNQMILRDML
ncbi:MAG: hypothetical protein OSB82_02050, partial [Alphaproteobacteria bacterium]|nr:hypothetical protein [Alphaproteobacteria bacterium]